MDSFTDYYILLGVDAHASNSEIKAAFKKLALQYHPDVYKGADAQERMRLLLLAYQTLNDPAARKSYDARRSEYVSGSFAAPSSIDGDAPGRRSSAVPPHKAGSTDVTPRARRDRQRHYDFPNLDNQLQVHLGDVSYTLSSDEALQLKQDGMLRGVAPEAQNGSQNQREQQHSSRTYFCHRCRHRWMPQDAPTAQHLGKYSNEHCPVCQASDWADYLLLRCTHCSAVFESEQIRYEIGNYNYGDKMLCPPYELFPLCPYCGASHWCPAEETRVAALARRACFLRMIWVSILVIAVLVLGVMLLHII